MVDKTKYVATADEEKHAAALAGIERSSVNEVDVTFLRFDDRPHVDVDALLREMGEAAFSGESGAFAAFVARNTSAFAWPRRIATTCRSFSSSATRWASHAVMPPA